MLKKALLSLCFIAASAPLFAATSGKLEIYWIDAEGGAATLIVSPSGESLLVDTANRTPDDRDAKRIFATAQKAGLTRIDYLLTTHFHGDHIGAMPALAKLIPIEHYLDHGPSIELARPNVAAQYKAYEEQSAGKRTVLKPGDKIPLKGVDIQVLISAGTPIAKALKGAGQKNPTCADYKEPAAPEPDPDNDQSVGIKLTYGKFDFIDLGDLTWRYEQKLVCPTNLIGQVDLYQTTHHGLNRSNSPQFISAVHPTVAIMNNGARKGGPPDVFETLHKYGVQDIWQGHFAQGSPKEVNSNEQMIANMEPGAEDKAHLIVASVEKNGKFTITNLRNNYSKTYDSK